jgi:hypothetical protein
MPPHTNESASENSAEHETRFVLVNPPAVFTNDAKMSHSKPRTVHGKTNDDNSKFVFYGESATPEHFESKATSGLNKKIDFKNKVRTNGAKGKEGSSDFTRGKSAFARPCTVGWKSQNQPLQKGGGNRTPL